MIFQLDFNWFLVGFQLVFNLISVGFQLVFVFSWYSFSVAFQSDVMNIGAKPCLLNVPGTIVTYSGLLWRASK